MTFVDSQSRRKRFADHFELDGENILLRITGLIWLENIIEKLERKHGVQRQEVNEVFYDIPYVRFVEKGHYPGENVYVALGQTEAGRYLAVFFAYKEDGRALILSARDMTHSERRKYDQR